MVKFDSLVKVPDTIVNMKLARVMQGTRIMLCSLIQLTPKSYPMTVIHTQQI